MNRSTATERIVAILTTKCALDILMAEYVATHIYADVVAVAVDDERNDWILIASRKDADIS
jgi:hypothetical protein